MKQTAVEWLEQQLFNKRGAFNKSDIDQAKEMEKEQIIEAASNNSAKEAYRAGQDSMYCGCYEIDGCTNYEEWIYKKQTYESNTRI
jgi:hypothetical protein